MTAVLFDMDGVLVDVSGSYLVAIQKTAEFFLGGAVALPEIQNYRNQGGLNNDWDLTECLLRERGKRIDKRVIIEVFQKIYLGQDFNGLITNEKWLLKRDVLDRIAASSSTGIVTGRPSMEARYVLERFSVAKYFPALITMDDLPPDKNKPDPLGIRLAMQLLSADSAVYLGDTVDDMVAAKRAGVKPIGVISPGSDEQVQKEVLFRTGASCVLSDINDILEVLP